jgi:hypothetical protein
MDVALHACPPRKFVLKYFWICNIGRFRFADIVCLTATQQEMFS